MNEEKGFFGNFGGKFVAETLVAPLEELEKAFTEAMADENFLDEVRRELVEYAGRPTPVYFCERLSREIAGDRVLFYLKREDLLHTGSHKINNAIGQALLAKRMGKKTLIAETGAGQHGVAVATVAARYGLNCIIYMGEVDVERQKLNVSRMKLLGAEVRVVKSGSRTLKDAINEALREWTEKPEEVYYLIGSAVGPHPYPEMVARFQSVIGEEAREQFLAITGELPDSIIACVGGGSNAIGIFRAFLEDRQVRLYGVEGGGKGDGAGENSRSLGLGAPGIFHGARTCILSDSNGQVTGTHSIAPGLDYPGVGPEHAFLKESGRVEYGYVRDEAAVEAYRMLAKYEGILPALESAHALAFGLGLAQEEKNRQPGGSPEKILINLSGRGDKDLPVVMDLMKDAF